MSPSKENRVSPTGYVVHPIQCQDEFRITDYYFVEYFRLVTSVCSNGRMKLPPLTGLWFQYLLWVTAGVNHVEPEDKQPIVISDREDNGAPIVISDGDDGVVPVVDDDSDDNDEGGGRMPKRLEGKQVAGSDFHPPKPKPKQTKTLE